LAASWHKAFVSALTRASIRSTLCMAVVAIAASSPVQKPPLYRTAIGRTWQEDLSGLVKKRVARRQSYFDFLCGSLHECANILIAARLPPVISPPLKARRNLCKTS
jgi:hypothetical protein